MTYETVFEKLWETYTAQNPQAKRVYDLFTSENEVVENDHIAFRTINHPKINIDRLAEIFLKIGYTEKQTYSFDDKHLNAKHFEHKTIKNAPRIFISELIVEEFSPYLQSIMSDIIAKIPEHIPQSEEFIISGCIWGQPSYEIYHKLRQESEYAAWFYVYGFRVNHFTVSINALKKYNTIEKVNTFLKQNGYILNSSGGEIKGKKEEFLQQSSVMAEILEKEFVEGVYQVPACYYEFAIRYPDVYGELFSGFIAKSADKIFESTDFYKI